VFLDQRGAVATSVPLKAGFISDDLAKKNSESLDPAERSLLALPIQLADAA
jgi:hypothetical protein